jgi:LPS-assembly lipoprotein
VTRRGVLVLGAAVMLTGCGFQPVYMPTATGAPGPAERNLAAIRVDLIPDRPGQELRQALQQRLGSDSGLARHRYDLSVSYGISGEGIGILPDTTASRIRLIANATYQLRTADAAQTVVTSGSANAIDGFNVIDQQYFQADLSNARVDRRLADTVANAIAMQLAVFFRHRAAVAAR